MINYLRFSFGTPGKKKRRNIHVIKGFWRFYHLLSRENNLMGTIEITRNMIEHFISDSIKAISYRKLKYTFVIKTDSKRKSHYIHGNRFLSRVCKENRFFIRTNFPRPPPGEK